jgi:hypothetical protein
MILDMVASDTLYNLAIWAPVLRSESTLSIISLRCSGLSFGLLPPMRPSSRSIGLLSAHSTSIIIRPAGVVVSMASVRLLNPAPFFPIFSIIVSRSFRERERRSSFQTKTTSPLRRLSIILCISGLSPGELHEIF